MDNLPGKHVFKIAEWGKKSHCHEHDGRGYRIRPRYFFKKRILRGRWVAKMAKEYVVGNFVEEWKNNVPR